MKRKILQALVLGLVFLLGFQVGRLSKSDKSEDSSQAVEMLADDEADISAECNGVSLGGDSIRVSDYKGEPVALAELAGEQTLFARFSSSACRPCMDALTASLQRFAASHPGSHVVFLLGGMQPRDLYVLAPQFGPQFTLLSCEALPIDFDGGETPVVFQLDSAMAVRNHFTCRYGDYARTDRYLGGVFAPHTQK